MNSDNIAQECRQAFEKRNDFFFFFLKTSVVMCGLWKDHWFDDRKDLNFNFASPAYDLHIFK